MNGLNYETKAEYAAQNRTEPPESSSTSDFLPQNEGGQTQK